MVVLFWDKGDLEAGTHDFRTKDPKKSLWSTPYWDYSGVCYMAPISWLSWS